MQASIQGFTLAVGAKKQWDVISQANSIISSVKEAESREDFNVTRLAANRMLSCSQLLEGKSFVENN